MNAHIMFSLPVFLLELVQRIERGMKARIMFSLPVFPWSPLCVLSSLNAHMIPVYVLTSLHARTQGDGHSSNHC